MGGAVSDFGAASLAAVYDDITALWVGQGAYRTKYAAAFVRPVTRIYIHVQRAKAKWTVISRGKSERKHLFAAVFTDEAGVVLFKPFFFHTTSLIFQHKSVRKYLLRFLRQQLFRQARRALRVLFLRRRTRHPVKFLT